MRTVILPDIHQKPEQAEAILLKTRPWDQAVFTGDYFDDWADSAHDAARTAKWIVDIDAEAPITKLLGNHDVHYLYPALHAARCSGFTSAKLGAIGAAIDIVKLRRQLLPYIWVDGWLVSHAGIHPRFLHGTKGKKAKKRLNELAQTAVADLEANKLHYFFDAGADRGGSRQVTGGINWLDWDSFIPIAGINQIVGHSFDKKPRMKQSDNSTNFCIDTALHHYIVIEDGQASVEEA